MSDNPLTDGPLRYVGFSNDLGEALKTLIPRPVYYGSYAVAFGYAALDTGLTYPRAAPEMAVRETARTGVWHLGATIISTPLIIKAVTHKITQLLRPTSLTPLMKTSIPSVIGVLCIPLIVPPIDQAMHLLTNRVFESVDIYLNEKTGTDLHTKRNSIIIGEFMIYLKIEPFSFLGKENEYRVKVEAKAIYVQAREEIMELLQTATKKMYTEFGLTSDAPIERHFLRFYQLAIEEINQEIKHPNLWISLD